MTEADLVDDLARLLRDGLVYVEQEDDQRPRFSLTARGRALSTNERLFKSEPRAAVDPVPAPSHT